MNFGFFQQEATSSKQQRRRARRQRREAEAESGVRRRRRGGGGTVDQASTVEEGASGETTHVAKDHEDTTEGATHCFQVRRMKTCFKECSHKLTDAA